MLPAMKVASLVVVALVLYIAFPGPIQAKKPKPPRPPKFCLGEDGNQYKVGKGYVDKEACVRYVCAKKKKKLYMKEIQLPCSTTSTTPRTTIEPEVPVNVTALEINVQSLNDSMQSLQAAMKSMQINVQSVNDTMQSLQATLQSTLDMMTNIQSAVNKQGTCMSDLSSSDCPLSATNKTGVAAGITSNTAALATKCDSSKCDANTDALDTKCDASTCSSINTTASQLETCLADFESTECPSKDGKTSVVEAIKENQDAIETYHPTPSEPINLVLIGGNGLSSSVMIGPAGICSQTFPSLPVVASDSEAVYIDNQIMVCGGHKLKKACYVLRKSATEWEEGPEMNEERSYFRLVKAKDEVFAIGGHDTNTMEKYSGGKWSVLNPMPSKRFESCTVYWKTIDSLVNIAGAYGIDSVKAFNLQTEQWSDLPSLPYTSRLHDCAVLNETIYVVGGIYHHGTTVLKYTYGSDSWEESGRTNRHREYHTVNALDGNLLVIGSYSNGDNSKWIERMKDDETWTYMPWILPEARNRHAVAEVPEKDFPCHMAKK